MSSPHTILHNPIYFASKGFKWFIWIDVRVNKFKGLIKQKTKFIHHEQTWLKNKLKIKQYEFYKIMAFSFLYAVGRDATYINSLNLNHLIDIALLYFHHQR